MTSEIDNKNMISNDNAQEVTTKDGQVCHFFNSSFSQKSLSVKKNSVVESEEQALQQVNEAGVNSGEENDIEQNKWNQLSDAIQMAN